MVLVSSKKFKDYRIVGDPVSQAKIFQSQKADELIILFIDNNVKHRDKNFKNLIQKFSSETFMPLSIGGSVKSVKDFEFLLSNGADKVIVNSAVYKDINLIKKASKIFGSQCVVVSIDFIESKKDFYLVNKNNKFKVNIKDYIKKINRFRCWRNNVNRYS